MKNSALLVLLPVFIIAPMAVLAEVSEKINDRMSLELDDNGEFKVKSTYLTNFSLKIKENKTGVQSSVRFIEPAEQAIEFNFPKVKKWEGIFPTLEWEGWDQLQYAKRSSKDTEIKLDELVSKGGDWKNADISIRGGSFAGAFNAIVNVLDYSQPIQGESAFDNFDILILFLLDSLTLANTTASFAVDYNKTTGTKEVAESLQGPAQLFFEIKDNIDTLGRYNDYLTVVIGVGEKFYEKLKTDKTVDYLPEIEAMLAYYKAFSEVIKKLKDLAKVSKDVTANQSEAYGKELLKIYEPQFKGSKSLDDVTKAMAEEFAKEYKKTKDDKSKDDEEKSFEYQVLMSDYFLGPVNQFYKVLVEQEELKIDKLSGKEKEAQQRIVNTLKGVRIALSLYDIALNFKDYEKLAKEHPEKFIPLILKTGENMLKHVLEVAITKAQAEHNLRRLAVLDLMHIDVSTKSFNHLVGAQYMKAISVGNTFMNKLMPTIWDMATAPDYLTTSLLDGRFAPYGVSSVTLKVFKKNSNGSYELLQEIKPETGQSTISVADDDALSFGVYVHKPLQFSKDRAPWELSGSYPPSEIYSVLFNSTRGYTETILCGKRNLGNQKFSLNTLAYREFKPVSGVCGAGTFLGGAWYDETPGRTVYQNADAIPKPFRLEDPSLPIADYGYTYKLGDKSVLVLFNGLGENRQTITLNFVYIKDLGFKYEQVMPSGTGFVYGFDASQVQTESSDPIVNYEWTWGDAFGPAGLTSTIDSKATHTYKQPGDYTVRLKVTTRNGVVHYTEQKITVAAQAPVQPVITGLTPVNVQTSTYALKVDWSAQASDSFSVYMAETSFGQPVDLNKATKHAQVGARTQTEKGTVTFDNLAKNKTYYFIVSANKGTTRTLSAERTYQMATLATGKLNDTGIVTCGTPDSAATDSPSVACTDPAAATPAQQDAMHGRDYAAQQGTLSKVGGSTPNNGKANGFDFTKIGSNGQPLAIQNGTWNAGGSEAAGTKWDCVRDNVTGLLWENKSDDNGLRDKDWTYTWYNSNSATNGGSAGTASGGSCFASGRCDTEKFVADVNAAGLCGHNNWRMPTMDELQGIVDWGRFRPIIDTGYFLSTELKYWSASPYAAFADYAWVVGFDGGGNARIDMSKNLSLRLVRNN